MNQTYQACILCQPEPISKWQYEINIPKHRWGHFWGANLGTSWTSLILTKPLSIMALYVPDLSWVGRLYNNTMRLFPWFSPYLGNLSLMMLISLHGYLINDWPIFCSSTMNWGPTWSQLKGFMLTKGASVLRFRVHLLLVGWRLLVFCERYWNVCHFWRRDGSDLPCRNPLFIRKTGGRTIGIVMVAQYTRCLGGCVSKHSDLLSIFRWVGIITGLQG